MQKYEKNSETEYIKIHETEKTGNFLQITPKRSQLLKNHMYTYEKENPGNYPVKSDELKFTKASSTNMNVEFPRLNELLRIYLKRKIR